MDYLTILATRSLVLFESPISHASSAAPSPVSSPASSILSVTPPPVSLPLLSLMRDDAHCAHFLSNHILESSGAGRDTHARAVSHEATDSTTHRAILQEAEVLAWQQICRAKTFAQELGRHYGRVDSVREDDLAALAATHGIGLAPLVAARRRERSEARRNVAVDGASAILA